MSTLDPVLAAELLRDPAATAARCQRQEPLQPLVATCLVAVALGSTAFGAVVGSFRGGEQIVYAALKMPVAMLFALGLCVPAFFALGAVFGRPLKLRAVLALTMSAAGRASLLLLAFTPALWLAYDLGVGYHGAALIASIAYATAGLGALGVLRRGLGSGRPFVLLAFALVYLAAAGQTSWMLRPYLVRPRTLHVPFVRSSESIFVEAVMLTGRSAMGIYGPGDLEDRPSTYGELPCTSGGRCPATCVDGACAPPMTPLDPEMDP